MAQLVLTMAGSSLGNAIGGGFGGSLVALLGSYAGAIIDQELFGPQAARRKVEGARVGDIRLSGSAFGLGIPVVYGRGRLPANVIWARGIREGVHKADVSDMMRRLTKEELYRFDGTPLFPKRRAYTASFALSPTEADLYQAVTTYVREEMNRADRTGDDKRRSSVGFALQILQRRLASSPAAIHRSLERRRKRLEERLREEKLMRQGGSAPLTRAPALPSYDPDDIDEVPGAEAEEAEDEIVDQATAAATLAELEAEIVILKDLEERALRLKLSGLDAKWRELESILDEPLMLDAATGLRRKVLIFTEPKDTLEYLQQKIIGRVGDPAAVVVIHGAIAREVGRSTDAWSSITTWASAGEFIRNTFARQALPMTWDFSECNPFSSSTGNFGGSIDWTTNALENTPAVGIGSITQVVAQNNHYPVRPVMISTDPPYYDNIAYADMSDYFYLWHKTSIATIWPDLYRRITTPKESELVATPYRHGGREQAENFFMSGMGEALTALRIAAVEDAPLAIYYAFKQSEAAEQGVTSAGWASFLQAVVNAGLNVGGTWPVRTERGSRTVSVGTNALASSIVLVCRRRSGEAEIITRADFIRSLKREMPAAIDAIRKAGVGPVDMQQSVIGPGMGVFSRHAKVLEDDDSAMSVKTALALINRVWEEIENELDQAFDAETQVALAWFATYGFDARASGELITLANAKNVPLGALFASGVFTDLRGKAALTVREDLHAQWTPASDKGLTVWECVQHTARVLNAEDGGGEAAARLVAQMGPKAAEARALAYRLFEIATNKGWAAEALVYNELAQEWPRLEDLAQGIAAGQLDPRASQGAFAFAGEA